MCIYDLPSIGTQSNMTVWLLLQGLWLLQTIFHRYKNVTNVEAFFCTALIPDPMLPFEIVMLTYIFSSPG